MNPMPPKTDTFLRQPAAPSAGSTTARCGKDDVGHRGQTPSLPAPGTRPHAILERPSLTQYRPG
jgi:hypothetical protein